MSDSRLPSIVKYDPTDWQARTGSNLNRYVITHSSKSELNNVTIDLSNIPEVTTKGTKFTADSMNNIEKGIENATGAVINAIDTINSLLESTDPNRTTTQHAVVSNKIGKWNSTEGAWDTQAGGIGDVNTPVYVDIDGTVAAATPYIHATVGKANGLSDAISITIDKDGTSNKYGTTIEIQNAGESKTIAMPRDPIFGSVTATELTVSGTINGQISTAEKLSSTNVGSSSIPVYFNSDGKPVASVYSNKNSTNLIDIGENLLDLGDVSHINLMNRVINLNLNAKFSLIATALDKIITEGSVYSISGTIIDSSTVYNVVKLIRTSSKIYVFTSITDTGGLDEITLNTVSDGSHVLDINIMIIRGTE